MFEPIINAFTFPFSDKKWPLKIALGGLFSLSTFFLSGIMWMGMPGLIIGLILLVALIIPMGYIFKVLTDAIEGKAATLPEWGDWEKLLRDGVIVFIIWVAYALIFYILAAVLGLIMGSVRVLYPILSLLNIIIALLILVVPTLIMVSICNFARQKNLVAAYDFKTILTEVRQKIGEYSLLILLLLGTKMLFVVLQGQMFALKMRMFGTFPLVSILTPFLSFYIMLVVARLYGTIFAQVSQKKEKALKAQKESKTKEEPKKPEEKK